MDTSPRIHPRGQSKIQNLKSKIDVTFELPKFRDRLQLQQALTHRSYANENPEAIGDNERLEYLGDAILTFICGEFLYHRYADKPEGDLSALRASLVDETRLAEFATWLALGPHLRLGRGAERQGGRQNSALLARAFEAVVGAYYLDRDSDIEAVRRFVIPLFEAAIAQKSDRPTVAISTHANPKSRFQEWALATMGENPQYETRDRTPEGGDPLFSARVSVADIVYGTGEGRSKKEAQKRAAAAALDRVEKEEKQ